VESSQVIHPSKIHDTNTFLPTTQVARYLLPYFKINCTWLNPVLGTARLVVLYSYTHIYLNRFLFSKLKVDWPMGK
jgi:hypothetical protein